jgi:hypothetical protein
LVRGVNNNVYQRKVHFSKHCILQISLHRFWDFTYVIFPFGIDLITLATLICLRKIKKTGRAGAGFPKERQGGESDTE